jgi:hypothetical protein
MASVSNHLYKYTSNSSDCNVAGNSVISPQVSICEAKNQTF